MQYEEAVEEILKASEKIRVYACAGDEATASRAVVATTCLHMAIDIWKAARAQELFGANVTERA